jgi:multidrug efflux system membrane fusion protein
MNPRLPSARWSFCLILAAATVGCSQGPTPPTSPAPAVPVSQPVRRDVTDFVEYTGRTNAVNAVDVRARASGYLVRMPFREGAEVKAGSLLFEIDPKPYQAQLDQARAQLELYRAQRTLAQATLAMDQNLRKTEATSQYQINLDQAGVDQANAAVKSFLANVKVFQINLDYTRVLSLIDGQVSRYYLTLGNLVTQDQTLLTTVVSLDPMYVYFDMDQRTFLKVKQAINNGTIEPPEPKPNRALLAAGSTGWVGSPLGQGALVAASELALQESTAARARVQMGLEGEDGFPHEGYIDFVNNQFNPLTGTIAMRGVFANPKSLKGSRLSAPGMFVRVRLPISNPHPALLVIDRAIGSDQGLKYVYVVDAASKVQYRRVKTGPLQPDGLRVISEGLRPGERVVVGSLQQVRPGAVINPAPMPMPTLNPALVGQTPPAGTAPGGRKDRGR